MHRVFSCISTAAGAFACGVLLAGAGAVQAKPLPRAKAAPAPSPSASPSPSADPAPIAPRLKPESLRRVLEDRDVVFHADLEDDPAAGGEWKRYEYSGAMLVRAPLRVVRAALTDYSLYSRLIPYINRADFDAATKTLTLEGGIWKWRLLSRVRFEEAGPRLVRYAIVGGHFAGLRGEMIFEERGERGTLVYLRGSARGNRWPPALVVERGAEIVFGFTGRKMRSYIEERGKESPAAGNTTTGEPRDPTVPQPRSRLAPLE
jgi:hypothetical protein